MQPFPAPELRTKSEGPARQIDVSRQKLSPHCLEAILTRNYPRPRVIARQVRGKNCLAAIFAPRHQSVSSDPLGRLYRLECRKWGFKRWGFKEIRGNLGKKAFFLRFLDFAGALRALRKRVKKAGKGRKRPISAVFQEGRPDTPQTPIWRLFQLNWTGHIANSRLNAVSSGLAWPDRGQCRLRRQGLPQALYQL